MSSFRIYLSLNAKLVGMGQDFENSTSLKTCNEYPDICAPKIVSLSAALIEISLLENRAYF